MSELININDNRATIRWKLLTGASALALTAYVAAPAIAQAADADHPVFWIEGAFNAEQISGLGNVFAPAFVDPPQWASDGFKTPMAVQNMHLFSYGAEGKITYQPENSDWTFSAALQYGRANGNRHDHGQNIIYHTYVFKFKHFTHYPAQFYNFADTVAKAEESHDIIDFQAGKDVGLGMFGRHSVSNIGLGVRFAQLTSSNSIIIHARPYITDRPHNQPPVFINAPQSYFHSFEYSGLETRDFRGIGPSISWSNSIPIAGNREGEIAIDWGANAALLFGRQKTRNHHSSVEYYRNQFTNLGHIHVTSTNAPQPTTRSRSVTVPNAGGFAAVSVKFPNAKLSIGYRADFFFGAIDGGIDTRNTTTRGFYGPYASISIGIGD